MQTGQILLRLRRRTPAVAIGEPEMIDTSTNPRLSRLFPTASSRAIPLSKTSMAWKMPSSRSSLSQALGPGPGREETDPLPAGPRRAAVNPRWQKTQVPDAESPYLSHQGTGQRDHPFACSTSKRMADPGERIRHPAPLPEAHHVPWRAKRLQNEFGGDIAKFKVEKVKPPSWIRSPSPRQTWR